MSEIKKEEQSDTMQTQKAFYASCTMCPRACRVDRTAGQKGRCHVDAQIRVARAALHMWEEPCLSGRSGSGAVFFSGCALGCIFCQNREIASGKAGRLGAGGLAAAWTALKCEGARRLRADVCGNFAGAAAGATAILSRQRLGLRAWLLFGVLRVNRSNASFDPYGCLRIAPLRSSSRNSANIRNPLIYYVNRYFLMFDLLTLASSLFYIRGSTIGSLRGVAFCLNVLSDYMPDRIVQI